MPNMGDLINVTVVKIISKNNKEIGAIVKAKDGNTAFLPISELREDYVRNVSDVVKVGDVLDVRVIKIDRKNNKTTVSLQKADDTEFKRIEFEKKMAQFLKTSGEILNDLKKNVDRKTGAARKRTNPKKD